MIDGPSRHLSWAELACRDGTPYPEAWRSTRALLLASAFEAIRDVWGLPIRVTSGYRTRSHNRHVGGATYSQHVEGLALDLVPPRGVTIMEFYAAALTDARRPGSAIRAIGLYTTWLHIDCRESARLVQWRRDRPPREA